MRGDDPLQGGMFSYIMPEQRVPQDHPLRKVRKNGGCGVERDVAAVQQDLRGSRAAVDRAREAAALLTGVALAASFVPARRATKGRSDGRAAL